MTATPRPRRWTATITFDDGSAPVDAPLSANDLARDQMLAARDYAAKVIRTAALAGKDVTADIQLLKTTRAGTRRDLSWTAYLDERTGRVRATL